MNVSLKDIDTQIGYSSDIRDISLIFYNPALAEAERYDRITAYFNSKSFITAASGLTEFIKNGGKIRLILDTLTDERDKDAIEGKIQEDLLEDIRDIEKENVKNHVALLAWLLDEGRLEIKVARKATNRGLVHQKIGLMVDDEGNKVAFSGSVNETFSGWQNNIENLDVYKGWVEGQRPFVKDKEKIFKRYWWNKSRKVEVFDLQDAVRDEIIKHKPDTRKELEETVKNIETYQRKEDEQEELVPRYYQDDAIYSWKENGYRGIWKMATGTGKTLTAIWGLEELLKDNSPILTVVVCPFKHLIEQWREELENQGFDTISTNDYRWESQLESDMTHLVSGTEETIVLLTTYGKYHKKDFKERISDYSVEKLLIADEVHSSGAPTHSKGLIEEYDYRLGLSATPERYMDEEGTEIIMDYFEGIVQEYGLEKAIEEGHLSEYEYHVKQVDLSKEERDKYLENTKKVAGLMNQDNLSKDERETLETLLRKRSKILKKAENKKKAFKELIEETEMEKTIIFSQDTEQLEAINSIMDKKGVMYSNFTGKENNKQRKRRAQNLKEDKIDVLSAMNVLDEGFDLPAAKKAIILSSTGNEAQFIQRRGRVLRVPREEGESDVASIYDFLVFPGEENLDELEEYEESILEKELERMEKFAKIAVNTEDLKDTIKLKERL